MHNDHLTVLMLIPEGRGGVRSANIKLSHIKLAAGALLLLILFVIGFFMFTYNLYKDVAVKGKAVNQLVDQIKTLNNDLNDTQMAKEMLKGRLKDIEGKLLEMQDLLSKKGIKKDLSVGGEFIPVDRASESYLDFMEKDISSLFDLVKTLPIGKPMHGEINSGYGYRTDPFNSKLAFHSGIDFEAKLGDPVIATADGKVKVAGLWGGYGDAVIIKHKNGYQTLYGHLSKINVKVGQKVKTGEVIGLAGTTGRSTGVHLHYEVIQNGKTVDPINYLSLR